ncbi:hypothetical protein ACFFKL_003096 [Enterobacter hormaechei]
MAEQKVKLTDLPAATDTVDTAQLLINQNSTDQKLPVTHLLRAKNNLSDLSDIDQARANLSVPSVDEVNDKLTGFIDGSNTFLAGASLASRTDFIWDDESKSWYYWSGVLPKDVPAASTPDSTGGIGDGAWRGVGDANLSGPEGYKYVGGLDARLSLYDIAAADGDRDSDQLNSVFAEFKGTPVKIYSSIPLTFTIDKETTLYGDFDLSNCFFNLSGGRVTYGDERDEVDYIKQVSISSYPLKELTNKIPTSESLSGWENSLVKITSSEVDLYRLLNSVFTPRYKGEANFMTDKGELSFTLKNTYNDPITCQLIKLPTKRNEIKLPQFTGTVDRWAINIQRSLVDVYGVYNNSLSVVPVDQSILASSETYGVNWNLLLTGVKQTDSNSRYSLNMEFTLGHTFSKCSSGSGWRTIDGNYCRNVRVIDCTIDSFNMHYGCSGIKIIRSRIMNGLSFGTGAHDESVSIIDSDISSFGVRTDYGELKGDLYVTGGSIRIADDKTGTVSLLTCYPGNIVASGNPVQPRKLYLPKNIIISSNIYWPSAVTLNLIELKNNFKTQPSPLRDFYMPDLVDFSGSTFNGVDARFEISTAFHDYQTRNPTKFKLTPKNSVGTKLKAYLGQLAEYVSSLYDFETNMDTEFMNVTSGAQRSRITARGNVRRFRGYSGTTTYYTGALVFDGVHFYWPVDGQNNLTTTGFRSFTKVIWDGRDYNSQNAAKPVINQWGHVSLGNIGVDAIATDTRDTLNKQFIICTREGAAGNFNASEF